MVNIHKREKFEYYEILNKPTQFGRKVDIAINSCDYAIGLQLLEQGYRIEQEEQPVVVYSRTICMDELGRQIGTYGFSSISTRVGFSVPVVQRVRKSG